MFTVNRTDSGECAEERWEVSLLPAVQQLVTTGVSTTATVMNASLCVYTDTFKRVNTHIVTKNESPMPLGNLLFALNEAF